jgi:ABC-2 type transport system ATP-binding protein
MPTKQTKTHPDRRPTVTGYISTTKPEPNADCIVELDSLQKKYGDFTAVDGLELEVPYGQVFGVLGPNGAGKTTTLRMITGLLRPTGGSITIDGHDMATDSVTAKSVTGFIPDRPYVYDKLTAFEYLRFIGGLYEMEAEQIAERVRHMLSLFELGEWGDSLIESFSHGMKQRLVFAGALLPEPRLLVVDEPMVGLDPKGHRLIKNLFKELAHEHGMTVLLSTHTLEVAEEVCDQIVIINHGSIVARGTLNELRLESGESDGSLEEVFLRITEETEEERAEAVAARFGRGAGPDSFGDEDRDAS